MKTYLSNIIWATSFLLFLSIAGCSHNKPQPQDQAAIDRVLKGHIFATETIQPFDTASLFQLDETMKAFADDHVRDANTPRQKVVRLISALLTNENFNLKYDPSFTGTPQEVFYSGKANCLSFTILFISMARHVGIEAEFNNVEVPTMWDLQGDHTFIAYRHVNAIANIKSQGNVVVDLNLREYSQHYDQNIITQDQAIAQYFNNKGVESMYAGNDSEAFGYFKQGLALDSDASFLWSNLATLYKRHNENALSEVAYLEALNKERKSIVAISSLERLYRKTGELKQAEKYKQLAQRFRKANPYYHYWLASNAFKKREYKDALSHINRAISKHKKEHRFYFLKGLTLYQNGDVESARKSFDKAEHYSENDATRDRYQSKFERLLSYY